MTSLFQNYWSDVDPSFRFLKEVLQTNSRANVVKMINQELPRKDLDQFLIKDSSEFLRLSIINLLGYKYLVCGKYLAWGRVTMYYSQFYIVNCLLRLKGFALVHLNFIDESSLTVRIDRAKNGCNYGMQKCNSSPHQIIWKMFSQLYPNLLSSEDLGKFLIKERNDWNYDLFYASQATEKYALEEVEDRCNYNFLDPNYGLSSTAEEGEFYEDLMANFGYEEAGTGYYQKYAIDCFVDIGTNSKYRSWYLSFFKGILEDMIVFESSKKNKRRVRKMD